MIQPALEALLEPRDLSREEARDAMGTIMSGDATPAQIGGFLIALRMKGETPDEIAGFAEAIRGHVLAVRPQRDDLVDTAGTGGDGQATINISTAAALVAAAAGAAVAKHGNRAVSSASGSADVLEALGFSLDCPPERLERSIDELGFGFLFAPTHHPGFKHAAPVRRELATWTPPCNARFSVDTLPAIALKRSAHQQHDHDEDERHPRELARRPDQSNQGPSQGRTL